MDGFGLSDITALFVEWYRAIPGGVLSDAEVPKLLAASTAKNFTDIGAQLQFTKRCVLMFLCGFLRKLSKAEPTTRMSLQDLAAVFAPVILHCSENRDQAVECTKNMLVALSTDWRLEPIWPVPASAMVKRG